MPGLIGVVRDADEALSAEAVLGARATLRYHDWYVDEALFQDASVIATRTHLGVLDRRSNTVFDQGCACWVEGECYNLAEVSAAFQIGALHLPDLLIQAHRQNRLCEVLARIDGYFVGVVYDQVQQSVLLMSGRLGLQPLYVWDDGRHFAWASELKALLPFKAFPAKLNQDAFDCFMALGHMIGNLTWFKDVHQLGPSTLMTLDIPSRRVVTQWYWSWSQIKPQQIPFEEAARHLGTLIGQAVRKRTVDAVSQSNPSGHRVGVGLSGGLDSRAILAATDGAERPCYTFGQRSAMDIEIAQKVAAVRGNPHTVFYLTEENWLNDRFQSVWKVDGMKSLLHMHYPQFHGAIKQIMDINLNGFIADAVLGGTFISPTALNQRISPKVAQRWYKQHASFDNPMDSFYNIDCLDPYLINNRCRRHVHLGSVDAGTTVVQRNPLVDNAIIEWVYSLPEAYRLYNNLYSNALLWAFPDYFETIPWQTTGRCIQKTVPVRQILKKRLQQWLKTFAFYPDFKAWVYRSGLMRRTRDYADYEQWLRQPETVARFSDLLDPRKAFYPQFTVDNLAERYLAPHAAGQHNYAEPIGRAVTVELWLQQLKAARNTPLSSIHGNLIADVYSAQPTLTGR